MCKADTMLQPILGYIPKPLVVTAPPQSTTHDRPPAPRGGHATSSVLKPCCPAVDPVRVASIAAAAHTPRSIFSRGSSRFACI